MKAPDPREDPFWEVADVSGGNLDDAEVFTNGEEKVLLLDVEQVCSRRSLSFSLRVGS